MFGSSHVFNLFLPQLEHSPAFKDVAHTLRLLTIFKFNHKQPQDESGTPRVSRGEAHAGQGLAGGKDAGVSTYEWVPAQAVWEVLWFHPYSYERWKSSKEISLFQAAELTGPLQGLKLCCCLCKRLAAVWQQPAVQDGSVGLWYI